MNAKKCIVVDLDNTLWGGVAGEDGKTGIALALTYPGASFIAFQQALLDLYNRGVILAINSQNNEADALDIIRTHPNMILKEQHFAASRMNWIDKVENMRSLAKELNIGLDSMVFLDDNPANREAMRTFLPEVETPELPQNPEEYASFLMSLPYFQSAALTDEDKMRGNLYVTERLRREAEKNFTDKTEFLKSLKLAMKVYVDDVQSVTRLSQMSEKTNQFNVLKHPLTEEEMSTYVMSPQYAVISARIMDKFGDYGTTALAIAEKGKDEWHLQTLLMSCRVLGRGAEEAFLDAIQERARMSGVKKLTVAFVPSEKNEPARVFVEKYFSDFSRATDESIRPEWVTEV